VIPFLDLKAINSRHKAEIQEAISGVIDSGWYILGEAVKQFEEARERHKKFLD
jgi:dTDP-4-amino-4,6-dideoxygalactose transaminase